MYDLLLYALLVVALAIGWWLGRNSRRFSGAKHRQSADNHDSVSLSRDYFVGLNYLLTEQPDRAIETFSHALEVNSETIDTHITLGNLFRSRGEADRAVKIHQNLLARPALSVYQNELVQLELARDFMYLGVLDRAETLLMTLRESTHDETLRMSAKRLLITIFEREQEWEAALNIITRKLLKDPTMQRAAANWHCELALQDFQEGREMSGQKRLKRALSTYPGSIRANWIQAEHFHQLGDYHREIKALTRIPLQDHEFSPFILKQLGIAYDMLDDEKGLLDHLDMVLRKRPSVSTLLMRVERSLPREGLDACILWLGNQLEKFPSIRTVSRLTELEAKRIMRDKGTEQEAFVRLHQHLEQLAHYEQRFSCRHCGFQSERLYWHCPQCHDWETIKPDGEFTVTPYSP